MKTRLDDEFQEFMRGRWADAVRLAYGLTGDLGHAEDVAQAAFAKTYAAWPRVSKAGNPGAYVRQIVINENRNRFRKRRVRELPDAGVSGTGDADAFRTADTFGTADTRSTLVSALQTLPPRQRAVVVLRYWLDMSESETAAALGCSPGTVKSQASRALAALRKSPALVDGDFR